MTDLVPTKVEPLIIDPREAILGALEHAEKKVRSALDGTLDTIEGARERVLSGAIKENGYTWIYGLCKEIERYIDRMP